MQIDGEEVRLQMPATPQLLRVARLTAAGLAGRLGFSFDEIEDIKIAVDELCFALVGSKGRDGELILIYALHDGALEITGHGAFTSDTDAAPAPSEWSTQILAATVDEHELRADGFRVLKRRNGA